MQGFHKKLFNIHTEKPVTNLKFKNKNKIQDSWLRRQFCTVYKLSYRKKMPITRKRFGTWHSKQERTQVTLLFHFKKNNPNCPEASTRRGAGSRISRGLPTQPDTQQGQLCLPAQRRRFWQLPPRLSVPHQELHRGLAAGVVKHRAEPISMGLPSTDKS